MSGRVAYERSSYREDILALRSRGMTHAQIARELGISRATVFRILKEAAR